MNFRYVPNAITLTRMALAAPLSWLITEGSHVAALVVAIAAGLSDGLDGFLAKRFGWQTRLGGLIDPAADKLVLFGAVIGLCSVGTLPWWMGGLLIGRDLVIVAGAVTYNALIEPLRASPTKLSKVTTAAQLVLVSMALILELRDAWLPSPLLTTWLWLTAGLTAASGGDYVATWGAKAIRKYRQKKAAP
jgi:cardiolipin synthase